MSPTGVQTSSTIAETVEVHVDLKDLGKVVVEAVDGGGWCDAVWVGAVDEIPDVAGGVEAGGGVRGVLELVGDTEPLGAGARNFTRGSLFWQRSGYGWGRYLVWSGDLVRDLVLELGTGVVVRWVVEGEGQVWLVGWGWGGVGNGRWVGMWG